jgi:hypothetical protein
LQDIVLNLLFVGADTRLKDARGFDVMVEAARGGHGDVIDMLTRGGAKAGISGVLQVSAACVCQQAWGFCHKHPDFCCCRRSGAGLT